MQITAVKLDEWFFPGPENRLLARDMAGTLQAQEIYNNLINPVIAEHAKKTAAAKQNVDAATVSADDDTGYKSSERAALENQLLQIESVAKVIEEHEGNTPPDSLSDQVTE